MRASVIATVAAVLIGACTAGGKVIYVDDDANSPGDGASWATAYKYLQDALADANSSPKPVEIRVAQGLYRPDRSAAEPNGTGDRLASFGLVSGVALVGGHAGLGAADPNARNLRLHEAILSGDLGGNDVPGTVSPDRMIENAHTVVSCIGCDATTLIEGVVVTGASAEGALRYARGLYLGPSDARIRHSSFVNNCGTGAVVTYGAPRFDFCLFVGNVNRFSESRNDGAGLASLGASPIVTNCVFAGNWATGEYGSGAGFWQGQVGVIVDGPRLVNCTFAGNRAVRGRAVATGGRDRSGISIHVLNSILWDGGEEVFNGDHSLITIAYCALDGGESGIANGYGEMIFGAGNIASDPCFVNPGYWNTNGTPDDPNDDFWVHGDYHLMSQAGRWVVAEGPWVIDNVTSPCIDAGDLLSPIGLEPFPNGGRVNIGAYGGTGEASKSWFGGPNCATIMAGDINGDCRVGFLDLAILASHWLGEDESLGVQEDGSPTPLDRWRQE